MSVPSVLIRYWEFLDRPVQGPLSSSLIDGYPSAYSHTLFAALIFMALHISVTYSTVWVWPVSSNNISKKKREEFPSYVMALCHHFIIVPMSLYFIYVDYVTTNVDYFKSYGPIVPVTFGYFIADTIIYTVPEVLKGRYAYFIHHVVALLLLGGMLSADGPVVRYMPHFLIMEASSIFFSSAWILRQVGYRGSLLVTVLEYLFVVTYFLLRVLYLPFVLYAMADHAHTLGIVQYGLPVVMILQLYWFYQILRTLGGRSMGGGAKSADKTSTKQE